VAGAAFLYQFLAHDLTCGATTAFNLDALYGGGPLHAGHLYDPVDRGKLRVESGGLFEDLPRDNDNAALLGDPRNDENLIVGGLHAALLLAHNHALDIMRARRGRSRGGEDVYLQAQRLMRWHYQWLIVHEFLPRLVGQSLVDALLAHGRLFFRPNRAWLPVEFQSIFPGVGRSTMWPAYRANLAGDAGRPFTGLLFDLLERGGPDPRDLRGGARATRRFVAWQSFFNFGDGRVEHARRIAPRLASPTFYVAPKLESPLNLPQRILVRHVTWALPSGQTLARAVRAPVLAPSDLGELACYGLGFEHETPLLYYVLKEAQVLEAGVRLGPVGGRIVAEVILGLLQLDPTSYLTARPDWRPTLPARFARTRFEMADLLTFAGVDPTSRGQ
jgi:Animal haem peroxidase